MSSQTMDAAGIGIGPANLSLAALLARVPELGLAFYERRPSFEWHAGMMLPGVMMQTSFLKDLVTPVDPTSPFGFLSYLVATGRFYRFLNADFARVQRVEYADYLRWSAERIPHLSFGCPVREVTWDGASFRLSFDRGPGVRARNLLIGTGPRPYVPPFAEAHLGDRAHHSGEYTKVRVPSGSRRIAIVGGGQSGAEIFLDLLDRSATSGRELIWITRRPNLEPLDETAFSNEYFTPDYVDEFHRLPAERRRTLVEGQKLTGDGISPETLRQLSQRLYAWEIAKSMRSVGEARPFQILPHREVREMSREPGGFRLTVQSGFDGRMETIRADRVIWATGYRTNLPDCLAELAGSFERDDTGGLVLADDYSVAWGGPPDRRIYLQNAGRHSHGIADSQLSLLAWRAARIANSLVGRQLYPTEACASPLTWAAPGPSLNRLSAEG